ncbi:hypothetical protein [Rhizobium etli]|uniref:hypothetical protein n=1 Tax=Rhizobium etli TaxID=29449 RepID=UPI0012DB6E23|nr:hypothetical protein [Rhizobium etli]
MKVGGVTGGGSATSGGWGRASFSRPIAETFGRKSFDGWSGRHDAAASKIQANGSRAIAVQADVGAPGAAAELFDAAENPASRMNWSTPSPRRYP